MRTAGAVSTGRVGRTLARRRRAAVLAAAGLALAACGDGDEGGGTTDPTTEPRTSAPTSAPASSAPPSSAAPTTDPSDPPTSPAEPPPTGEDDDAPFEGTTGASQQAAEGAGLSPVDLRFAERQGFDRVVLDLAGEGAPGWFAGYTDDPRAAGSGNPVQVAGDAVISIDATGIQLPTEPGAQEYTGPERLTPDASGVVEEVVVGTLFEGQQQLFVGVASEQPYRVFRLADPPRLVVDVRHP